LSRRWIISFNSVIEPDLRFLEDDTTAGRAKYVGIDVRVPEELRLIGKYDDEWRTKIVDGVRFSR
jgi:hypothetical protein